MAWTTSGLLDFGDQHERPASLSRGLHHLGSPAPPLTVHPQEKRTQLTGPPPVLGDSRATPGSPELSKSYMDMASKYFTFIYIYIYIDHVLALRSASCCGLEMASL